MVLSRNTTGPLHNPLCLLDSKGKEAEEPITARPPTAERLSVYRGPRPTSEWCSQQRVLRKDSGADLESPPRSCFVCTWMLATEEWRAGYLAVWTVSHVPPQLACQPARIADRPFTE